MKPEQLMKLKPRFKTTLDFIHVALSQEDNTHSNYYFPWKVQSNSQNAIVPVIHRYAPSEKYTDLKFDFIMIK